MCRKIFADQENPPEGAPGYSTHVQRSSLLGVDPAVGVLKWPEDTRKTLLSSLMYIELDAAEPEIALRCDFAAVSSSYFSRNGLDRRDAYDGSSGKSLSFSPRSCSGELLVPYLSDRRP